jgi:cellulose synthase/poly-beta-1,6-N-acetylglucosamine synthase-like glycosyltransferase
LDKNLLIDKLADAIEQSKGDQGRNQYILNRIKENKEFINSDKLYLERILGLKITEQPDIQHQQISKKNKSVFLNPNLVKCATCNKEIKLDEKLFRNQNFWYHETCYKPISENNYEQEKIKLEKDEKTIILENINSKNTTHKEKPKIEKPILKHQKQSLKIKHDPVVILIACGIIAFVFIAPFYFIAGFSAGAMVLGGSLVLYQIIDARRWSKSDFRSRKHAPGIFSLFLLILPFVFGGLLAFEGFTLWESIYRSIILWGFTITFWSVMLMVPLALYSKNREDNLKPAQKFPLISVLIPAYNEEKVIARTIESALEIDYPKKEIIVIDDGSIDNTLLIAKTFEKDGVKVLHKENSGKATALNYAINFAKGEILAILDADTIAGKNSLKEINKVFENSSNVGGVAGNVKVRNKTNWITWCQALEYVSGLQIARRAFDMFGAITIVPGAMGAFKANILKDSGGYDKDTIVEDFDATIKVLKSGKIVRGTTKALAYTEAPETIGQFVKQRARWYRGNLQVVFKHKNVITNPRFGFLQKIAFPHMIISMLILPITSFILLGSIILAIIEGDILFVLGSIGFFTILQYLLVSLAVRIEKEDPKLILYAIFFMFGFKQIQDALLLSQLLKQLLKRKAKWTSVTRKGFNE